MKQLLLTLILFGFIYNSNAQSYKFLIKAGINMSSMTSTNNGLYQDKTFTSQRQETSNITGYHVGIYNDLNYQSFTLQIGVSYIKKGGRNDVYYTNGNYSYHSTEKLILNYIEVPVNILKYVPVNSSKIFFGGGPYIDMGISGTDKNPLIQTTGDKVTVSSVNNDVIFGNTKGNVSPSGVTPSGVNNLSYGLNALAGLRIKNGLSISANYGFSFTKVSVDHLTTARMIVTGFSLGYTFL